MYRIRALVCALGLWSLETSLSASEAPLEAIGLVGDSISTGGGAHPSLAFEREVIEKVFRDQIDLRPDPNYGPTLEAAWSEPYTPGEPARRLPLSRREFTGPLTWVYERAFHYISHRFLDAEEYSWGYLLARRQGLQGSRVYIAARDGENAADAIRQMDRLLDASEGRALADVFIFFTGNDLCMPGLSFGTDPDVYSDSLEEAVRYYARNAQIAASGTANIWLLDPLGILQIVSSPSILNQRVRAYGTELSCRDLQAGRYKPQPNLGPSTPQDSASELASAFANILNIGPRAYCPGLFAIHDGPSELQMRFGNALAAYRSRLEKLPAKLQNLPPQFRVHHVKATSEVIFSGEDMAQDCFHLGLKGQLKVAAAVRDEMQEKLKGAEGP